MPPSCSPQQGPPHPEPPEVVVQAGAACYFASQYVNEWHTSLLDQVSAQFVSHVDSGVPPSSAILVNTLSRHSLGEAEMRVPSKDPQASARNVTKQQWNVDEEEELRFSTRPMPRFRFEVASW